MQIKTNYSLGTLNTFGVNVESHYFCELDHLDQIEKLKDLEKPLILGSGSNILFTQNYAGAVVLNRLKGITILNENREHLLIEVASGEIWHQFVLYALQRDWFGVEALSLIPGTVGAAPVQNIGAYGVEVKSVIERVNIFNIVTGQFESLSGSECQFGYRDSIFKRDYQDFFIVSVVFKLSKLATTDLSYGALKDWFLDYDIKSVTPKMISDAVIEIRQSKLPDPKLIGNAGSFFKNPIISDMHSNKLKIRFPNLIIFPISDIEVKLVAGQLIELAGFKGKYENNVGMYEKQSLILVNLGGATGKTLMQHAQKVKEEVYQCFGVILEPEPLIL